MTFYVSTPIYYVNARPHLGHAYTTIVADVVRRFQSMRDSQTYFLTGTDEHGDKVVQAAQKQGVSPRVYVDQISRLFRDLWPELNVRPDRFIRTTDSDHMAVVTEVLRKIHAAGDIYFSEYEGLYCFGCERFYAERELQEGRCPIHESEPELIRESNYFFRMSRYQGWLIDHLQSHPDFIRPERYRNEVLAFLREPLGDLCISRPKTRLTWGIPLPFDEAYVTYVWFDALLNYVSALGYPDGELFHRFWPAAQHIVAKDILKPHGIYWPCMLKAAGIPVYRHLNVHGYWNIEQRKMSKSLGNVIEPLEMRNVYGLDAFRYFLIREMTFGLDANFSESAMVQRINADLANDLGNLFSRVLSMTHKYFDGAVPELDPEVGRQYGLGLGPDARRTVDEYERAMEAFELHKALAAVWEFIGRMNRAIDIAAPWELAKKPATRKQLEAVIHSLLKGLRLISGLIYPVMPDTAARMQTHLGLDPEALYYALRDLRLWKPVPSGTRLPKTVMLFPRIEAAGEPAGASPAPPAAERGPETKPEATLEDFQRIDLRVATVLSAEPVPKAKKLLKLEVDLGERRTIVSGIAAHYTPEALVGRQVVIIANLRPVKLMGVVSQGMLLTAESEDGPVLILPEKPVAPGSGLR
ncbi:MAG: methionine--tRNA ligase [Desulfobacterales bacterium]|jgi:methionyl-tRNA synthetase|nr:methionine--tRNA ligase [Desulfobacterales bacterium]